MHFNFLSFMITTTNGLKFIYKYQSQKMKLKTKQKDAEDEIYSSASLGRKITSWAGSLP